MFRPRSPYTLVTFFAVLFAFALTGCGTTKSRVATEQLLMSDAVDDAVSGIDFRALSGKTVFLDTQYIRNIKGFGFVNADYIVSSLRQQMLAAHCRLQESKEEADFIAEARVGTLGTNGHEVVYGVPANHSLSTAANFVPNVPTLPTIPEMSLGRKDAQRGAAKIAVFAYERETKRPVWQSGVTAAKSDAQDMWVFGVGPFQRGTIYNGTQFAGSEIEVPKLNDNSTLIDGPPIALQQPYYFPNSQANAWPNQVQPAGFTLPPTAPTPAGQPPAAPMNRMPIPPPNGQPPPAASEFPTRSPQPQNEPSRDQQ